MNKSTKVKMSRKALFTIGLTAVTSLGGIALVTTEASASSPSVMTSSWTPQETPYVQGPYYWTVAKGTSVTMQCWTTGPSKIGTAKWFYIASNAYPFTTGYVPANAVGRQSVVGHC